MQITKQQLERLRQNDSILYHGVLPGLSRSYGSSKDGPFTLDLSKVKEAFRNVFPEWAKKNIVEQPASDPELDAVTNPDPTPVAPVQPAVTKQTLDAADRNLKDLQEAEARFRYWLSQGLLDTPENTLLIESWLANQAGDHYSAGGIDSCIEANRAALMWYTPPVVEFIPGSKEVRLPLGTRLSNKYSVRQLQDLDRREREASSAAQRAKNTELAKTFQ